MSSKQSTVSAAAAGVAARAVTQISALAVTLVAARFLGPADFGLFAIASVATTYLRTLLYCGPYEHLLKTDKPETYSSEALIATLGLAVVVTVINVTLFSFSQAIFGSAAIAVLVWQLAPSNAISAVTAWQEAHVLRQSRIGAYYGIMLASELLAGGAAIAMLFYGFGIEALVAQIYIRALVTLAGYTALRSAKLSTSLSFSNVRVVAIWSTPRYGEVSLAFFAQYGADILLGAFLSPAAAGTYRAASRICSAVSDLVMQPLRVVALTQFSKRAARSADVGELVPPVSKLVGLTGWMALAAFAGVAGTLTPTLLGQEWRESGVIAPLLCLVAAMNAQSSVFTAALVASNLQRRTLALRLIATALLIGGVCILAPWGPLMAAAAVAFASLLSMLLLGRAAITAFPDHKRRIVGASMTNAGLGGIAGVTAFGALWLAQQNDLSPAFQLSAAISAAFASFCVCAALLARPILRALTRD